MIILGIDSGIERCGYAVFEKNGTSANLITYGLLSTHKSKTTELRMYELHRDFELLVKQYKPQKVVMEALFFNTNQKTFATVAQSQGALLVACGKSDIQVEFLSPPAIKQIVTGYGKADKKQVEKMIMILLKLKTTPKPDDVVDAIACGYAFCCLHTYDHL